VWAKIAADEGIRTTARENAAAHVAKIDAELAAMRVPGGLAHGR
jgi:hypothetical protein